MNKDRIIALDVGSIKIFVNQRASTLSAVSNGTNAPS